MVRLAQNEINFGRQVPLQEVVDHVESASEDDIIDLAASLFREDQLALTTLGPITDEKPFEKLLMT